MLPCSRCIFHEGCRIDFELLTQVNFAAIRKFPCKCSLSHILLEIRGYLTLRSNLSKILEYFKQFCYFTPRVHLQC